MRFTDRYILHLKPKDKMYQVREAEGFGVRVLPSGLRLFIFVYTIAGKRRQMNLGDYPVVKLSKAKDRAAEARKALKDGKDPQEVGFEWHKNPEREKREAIRVAEEDRRNPTVRQLADDYMARHAKVNKRESSWKEDQRLLDKNVLPTWGDRKANEIRKGDCVLLLDSFVDRPALCHNILKLTRKMFNFAIEKDILEFTPFAAVKAPVDLMHRERTLSESEISALWITELPKASMSGEVKRILKMILLTGSRPGEIAGIHVGEIEGNWWTIPVARSKNKQAHRVLLTRTALDLLGESKGYFFPSPKNGQTDKDGVTIINTHIDENAVAYAIRRNLKDYKPRRAIKGETISMVKVKEDKKMEMEHFTPHDLRRTMATGLAQIGFSDETIDSVLGHKKTGVVKIYNQHKHDNERQVALETWERKLLSILTVTNSSTTEKQNNVINIHRSKAA